MKRFETDTIDEKVGSIYKTFDYSKFKIDEINRPVNRPHAKSLYSKLIKDPNFVLEPIVVDKNFVIIDGQHRYTALRKAKMPIIYFVDRNINIADARILNSKQKNWSPKDYLIVFSRAENQNYIALLKEAQQFEKNFAITTLNSIFSDTKGKVRFLHGSASRDFKDGKFKFDFKNKNKKEQMLDFISKNKSHFKSPKASKIARNTVLPIMAWWLNPTVNLERLKKTLLTPKIINKLTNRDSENAKILGQLYNKGLRSNQIKFFLDENDTFHFSNVVGGNNGIK